MPDNEYDPARNKAEFQATQAEQIRLTAEILRRSLELGIQLEMTNIDIELTNLQLDLERQLAQARLDLQKSSSGLANASVELYRAFHPSKSQPPQPPTEKPIP